MGLRYIVVFVMRGKLSHLITRCRWASRTPGRDAHAGGAVRDSRSVSVAFRSTYFRFAFGL